MSTTYQVYAKFVQLNAVVDNYVRNEPTSKN